MEIFLVGGAVRDELLNYPVYDKDWVVVGATPAEMLAEGYKPVGSDFPVFIHPVSHEEYALARTERKSGKGYMGFQYHASPDVTLEEDLSRRDLTINAMAKSDDGRIIDPYGGQKDLADKVLRHVSPAFEEDPLRVLRVARFAARYHHLGFHLAPETLTLMQKIAKSDELEHLTKERTWQELERAINEANPLIFFSTLSDAYALKILFPAFTPLVNNEQAAKLEKRFLGKTSAVRFATLCYLSFYEQIDASAKIKTLCEHLKTPNLFRDLALQLHTAFPVLANWQNTGADERFQLITQLDLLRRPERVAPLLDGCRLLSHCFESKFDQEEDFLALLSELKTVTPAELLLQGFKGAALGAEIKRLQLKMCQP